MNDLTALFLFWDMSKLYKYLCRTIHVAYSQSCYRLCVLSARCKLHIGSICWICYLNTSAIPHWEVPSLLVYNLSLYMYCIIVLFYLLVICSHQIKIEINTQARYLYCTRFCTWKNKRNNNTFDLFPCRLLQCPIALNPILTK